MIWQDGTFLLPQLYSLQGQRVVTGCEEEMDSDPLSELMSKARKNNIQVTISTYLKDDFTC